MKNREVCARFVSFFTQEDGQDLIEYTLLLALMVLSTAAMIVSSGQSSKAIWDYNDQMLTQATTVAQSTGAGGSVPPGFGNGAGNSGAGGSTNGVGNGNSFGNGNGNGLGVGNGNGAGSGAGNGNSNNGRGNR